MGYGICWVAGESAGRVEVFYSSLNMVSMEGSNEAGLILTPLYLCANFESVVALGAASLLAC
jgi:hypothetical protein